MPNKFDTDYSQLDSLLDDREMMEEIRNEFPANDVPTVTAEMAYGTREFGFPRSTRAKASIG